MNIKITSKLVRNFLGIGITGIILGTILHLTITVKDETVVHKETIGCMNAICVTHGSRGKHCFESPDRIAKLVITENADATKQIHLEFSRKACGKN